MADTHVAAVDLRSAIKAALDNAARLAEDAAFLAECDKIQTAFVISVLAREEFAKGFLLILSQSEQLPWTTKASKRLAESCL